MKHKLGALILIGYGITARLHSQGYIVANGVTYGGLETGMGYSIFVNDNPSGLPSSNSQYTKFWLNPVGESQPNAFSLTEQADIGVRIFLVSANDPIILQPISSQTYTELQQSSSYVFEAGVPFYVGLYTGYEFAPPYPPYPPYNYIDPVFGWAELENVGGAIQMLGSALEYQGGGIIAGTDTIIPVPEPSALGLSALLGATLLAFGRRRN